MTPTFLFDWIAATTQTAVATLTDRQGFRHRFRYLSGAPLNDAKFDLAVNFLEYLWSDAAAAMPSPSSRPTSWRA